MQHRLPSSRISYTCAPLIVEVAVEVDTDARLVEVRAVAD